LEVKTMDSELKKRLQQQAAKIRMNIIDAVYSAKSGHPGGSLSIADTLTYLYFAKMHVDPKNPKMKERDRFVLSKGHCAPGLYSTLAERGFFDVSELKKLRQVGAMLQGHPDMKHTPGVDMSTGSLGQGISAAAGMALAGKIDSAGYKVYTILGDGELEEGQVWEAAMFAGHNKLDNLVAIIDNNGLQIDGKLSDVCSPMPITDKFAAFGWHVITMNAHDFDSIEKAFDEAEKIQYQPVAIVQTSVKGKGVSFMENNAGWHGKAPNAEQYEQAMTELKTAAEALN
jgi:transketolase